LSPRFRLGEALDRDVLELFVSLCLRASFHHQVWTPVLNDSAIIQSQNSGGEWLEPRERYLREHSLGRERCGGNTNYGLLAASPMALLLTNEIIEAARAD